MLLKPDTVVKLDHSKTVDENMLALLKPALEALGVYKEEELANWHYDSPINVDPTNTYSFQNVSAAPPTQDATMQQKDTFIKFSYTDNTHTPVYIAYNRLNLVDVFSDWIKDEHDKGTYSQLASTFESTLTDNSQPQEAISLVESHLNVPTGSVNIQISKDSSSKIHLTLKAPDNSPLFLPESFSYVTPTIVKDYVFGEQS